MRFGNLNRELLDLVYSILTSPGLEDCLPFDITSRQPLFDQAIYNIYLPGEGIKPHVDLAVFDDGIVGISLVSSTLMIFSPASPDQMVSGYDVEPTSNSEGIEVNLDPGDILCMYGPSRYLFTHSISNSMFDILPEAGLRQRSPRISITLRRMVAPSEDV
ncbi:hypothetical protein DSO57_1020840 [Entomophthora muscae]|uniref:Uncharacterized protein n=1 Tax=Entomophthora muscae TaxID=34485 RepID=A0ACC2UD66_9FUNG|nr:hypothetical protein DSO57_1020840 [Entomophthora muscae]